MRMLIQFQLMNEWKETEMNLTKNAKKRYKSKVRITLLNFKIHRAVAALEKKSAHENQKKSQEQQLKELQTSKEWQKGSKDNSKLLLAEEKRV